MLILGDRAFSSWSLRGWLLFHAFGLDVPVRFVSLADGSMARTLANHAPARTVPT
ncbi:hypothetical protein OCGS_1848 [Oceaniovalibus guishaninsula JLT2003]|uniref:GST N-terminal domain-containing protein n=1 Tax=Oceaniovalibus guishaninsula JLT2003 TaxID=1231392 RepID=K2HB19_9RHOB|nr:hypothetical protein [Oceaniovalibus guishaninsula]EKE43867.1 hypothetical protein OCGS_1848 [Oceaniovalibus guishaninsula JLT2003]